MSMGHRYSAYVDLFKRYGQTIAFFWQRRRDLSGRLLSEQEAEFLPAALSIQERPISPTGRVLASLIMLIVVLLIAWSCFGKFDIVVMATGKVVPSGRTKAIAAVEMATVKAVHVREGAKVKAGDLLVELDTGTLDAEKDKAEGDQATGLLQAARSTALIRAIETGRAPVLQPISGVDPELWERASLHLESQWRDYTAKVKRLNDEIDRFKEALPLAIRRANDFKLLLPQGDVSSHAWMEREQARIDLQGQLVSAEGQLASLAAELRRTAHDQFTEANRLAASSKQDARRSDAHSSKLKLLSPVDGTVMQLDVHAIGSVVTAGKPVMFIVPEDGKVEVEAFLDNKDMGFIHVGQKAKVKVDAFDFTKFGGIEGLVAQISSDAIMDEKRGPIYSTRVALERSTIQVDTATMAVTPGMSVNVEIKTGTRRIIEYFLSPLLKYKAEVLHER